MATAFAETETSPMRELKSKSFTVSLRRLTTVEQRALDYCADCAKQGRVLTRLDLCLAVGSQNYYGGTGPGILNRLEQAGYIERLKFQRGVQVRVVGMDLWTAPPPCTVKHWRDITDRVPVPAIHQIRQSDMPLSRWIETEARARSQDMADFLMELVRRGAQDYRAEAECPL